MKAKKTQNKFMFLDLLSTIIKPLFGSYVFKIIRTDSTGRRDLVDIYKLFSNTIYLSSSWSKKRLLIESLYRVLLNEIVPEVTITYNMSQRVRTAIWFVETIKIANKTKNRALQLYTNLFTKELKKWKPTIPADEAWKVFASFGLGRFDCQDSFDQKMWQDFYNIFLKVSQLNIEDKIKGYIALYYMILEEIIMRNMKETETNAMGSIKETLDKFNLSEPNFKGVSNLQRDVRKIVTNTRDRFIAQRIMIKIPYKYHDKRSERVREFEQMIANTLDKDKILKKLVAKVDEKNEDEKNEDTENGNGNHTENGKRTNDTFILSVGGNIAGIGRDLFKDFEIPLTQKDTQFLTTTKSEIKLIQKYNNDVWYGEPEISLEESIITALQNGFIIQRVPILVHGFAITETESKKALIALVDTSGSMAGFVKQIKTMLLATIQKSKINEIAIMGFGDFAFWVVRPTKNIYHAIARIKGIFSAGGTSIAPALKLLQKYNDLIKKGELVIITDGYISDRIDAVIEFKKLQDLGLKRVFLYLCNNEEFKQIINEAGIEVIQIDVDDVQA